MFAPEEQQIGICLLKTNLDAIQKELVDQRSALPALDAATKQKTRELLGVLQNMRNMRAEMERLKVENVERTAKREVLKRQTDDISESLDYVRQERTNLFESLKQENEEIEVLVRQYEDSLIEKAARFRKTHRYYNEEEINTEIEDVNSVIAELKDGMSKKQSTVDELRAQMDALHPDVPENLLEQVGKLEIDEKLKMLSEKQEKLEKQWKSLAK